jgi:hypothetical protein
MEQAYLLRVLNKSSVCVLLRNGPGAVIQADLTVPLSPRSMIASQSINALNSIPVRITLGEFDADNCKFLNCTLDADFPEPCLNRVNYLARKKPQ